MPHTVTVDRAALLTRESVDRVARLSRGYPRLDANLTACVGACVDHDRLALGPAVVHVDVSVLVRRQRRESITPDLRQTNLSHSCVIDREKVVLATGVIDQHVVAILQGVVPHRQRAVVPLALFAQRDK